MSNKNLKPTFGISFGLPQQGGGGYPINPHGPHPLVNPYGSSVGAAGINLGLVSVNPLVSVQVTKDDYGQKVVKPFINLHVTPNNYLVHKLEDLLAYKKDIIYNKHQHFHQYNRPHKYHIHKPHYHHRPHPPVIYSSPFNSPDVVPDYDENENVGSYYDDQLNYGSYAGGYDGYDGGIFGRVLPNITDVVDGNPLQNQYQDKFNSGFGAYPDTLGDYSLKSDRSYNTDNRRGKSLIHSTSNVIKFPTSRKRRDTTEHDTLRTKEHIKVSTQNKRKQITPMYKKVIKRLKNG